MKRSELTKLNQKRWQDKGQLLRTASLLNSMQNMFPNLRGTSSVSNAIGALIEEAEFLQEDYELARAAILKGREQKK